MNDIDKYKGHHICVECGSDEIPLSGIDAGEVGLTDYYFSCSECNFSWYVAVRTDEHEDGASAGIDFVGWVDEDGNLIIEGVGRLPPYYARKRGEQE